MQKVVISILMFIFSASIFAAPSFQSTAIAVLPQDAPKVAAALDEWMNGFGKKSNGRVILQAHVADGINPATHSIISLTPSMAAGEAFNEQVVGSKEGMAEWQAFMAKVTPIATVTATSRSALVKSWGKIDDGNDVWLVHSFSTADASSLALALGAWMNSPTGKNFPGEAHLLATVAAGAGAPSHVLAIGYTSLAQMEEWGATARPSGDMARLLHSLSEIADYHGANLVTTAAAWGKSAKSVLN